MYASEKYVKLEVKELLSQIQAVSADLGSDIQHLHSIILEQREQIALLQQTILEIKDRLADV